MATRHNGSDGRARAALRGLAREKRARIRNLKLRIPGVDGMFDQEVRFSHDGVRLQVATNGRVFLVQTRVSSAILFSLGEPAAWMYLTTPIGYVGNARVFAGDDPPRAWLSDEIQRELLEQLQLTRGEQLLVVRNEASMILRSRDRHDLLDRVNGFLRIVDRLPLDEPADAPDFAALPSELEPLKAMIVRWGYADDDERAERIALASRTDLVGLSRACDHYWPAINRFLDAPRNRDLAPLVDAFAQASLEARAELERRRTA
jgi:hypothetical protein